MRRKMIMFVFVIAGCLLLFAPLAVAADDAEPDKAKQSQKKAQKKKAHKKAEKKEVEKKKAKKKTVRATASSSASASALAILDAKTTSEVEDREPVGSSASFNAGDKVTVWLAVKNPKGPSKVNLVFLRNDAEAGTIELEVGKSYRWRTWARRTVGAAGDWKVDVRDEDGNSLETLEFKVN